MINLTLGSHEFKVIDRVADKTPLDSLASQDRSVTINTAASGWGAQGSTAMRKLNKKKYELESNPAAAIYGESQVGKSYLISSLLSEVGNPFSITDENDVVHNFIEKIKPNFKLPVINIIIKQTSGKMQELSLTPISKLFSVENNLLVVKYKIIFEDKIGRAHV